MLRDLIVLDAQWLIDKICHVLSNWHPHLDDHITKEDYIARQQHHQHWLDLQRGVLHADLLKAFWNESVPGVKMEDSMHEATLDTRSAFEPHLSDHELDNTKALLRLLDRLGVICRGANTYPFYTHRNPKPQLTQS